jgi:hypothetical protein
MTRIGHVELMRKWEMHAECYPEILKESYHFRNLNAYGKWKIGVLRTEPCGGQPTSR